MASSPHPIFGNISRRGSLNQENLNDSETDDERVNHLCSPSSPPGSPPLSEDRSFSPINTNPSTFSSPMNIPSAIPFVSAYSAPSRKFSQSVMLDRGLSGVKFVDGGQTNLADNDYPERPSSPENPILVRNAMRDAILRTQLTDHAPAAFAFRRATLLSGKPLPRSSYSSLHFLWGVD